METSIDLGGQIAPLTARVNRRARQLIIKVDPVTGRVIVTAPSKRALPEAIRFANDRRAWINARLDEGAPAQPFEPGGYFPYRGLAHEIINSGPARSPVRCVDGESPHFLVGGEAVHINRRLVDWLKKDAKRTLSERAHDFAGRLGKNISRVQVRDTRSRWGSCSSDGALSFSWRLILAPPAILDYVAAHECAHLVHLDHSPAFWRTVKSLEVDVDGASRWFDLHGVKLHAWGVQPPLHRAA